MRLPCHPTLAAVLSVALTAAAAMPLRAQPLQTTLAHVILIDAATRTVLFERGADDLVVPASTAKLMTADIVFGLLKSGKLKHDQMLYVSDTAWREGGAPSRGSTMFAKLHSQISVDDLLRGLIVDSANDAAIVLAEGVAGNEGAFATQMTNHARELAERNNITAVLRVVRKTQQTDREDDRVALHRLHVFRQMIFACQRRFRLVQRGVDLGHRSYTLLDEHLVQGRDSHVPRVSARLRRTRNARIDGS